MECAINIKKEMGLSDETDGGRSVKFVSGLISDNDETCMSNLPPGPWRCVMEAPFAHDGAVIRIPHSA